MSKLGLDVNPSKQIETPSTESTSTSAISSRLNQASVGIERARNDFAESQNPFSHLKKRKRLAESSLREISEVTESVEALIEQKDLPEVTPPTTSALDISQSSLVNADRELAKNLEGRSHAGELVINSSAKNKPASEGASIFEDQTRLLQAEQRKERLDALQQQALILELSRDQARLIAKEQFKDNPNRVLTNDEFQSSLKKILSETNANQPLASQIQEEFVKTYIKEREKLFEEMNWAKRKYYQAKGWCSGKIDQLQNFGHEVADTCVAVSKGISKLAVGAYELASNLDWKKIGEGSLKILATCGKALIDPDFYLSVAEWTGKAALWTLKTVGKTLIHIATDPIGCIKGAWGFICEMSSSMGLTQMINGVVCFAKAPYQYLIDLVKPGGGFAVANHNLKENLIAAKDGVVGALQCVCQITGLADCYYTIKHAGKALILYGQGKNLEAALEGGQALMHLAFAIASASSIVATVSTLGAASGTVAMVVTGRLSLNEGIEQIGKQALKAFGKELAENALGNVPKNVLESVTEQASREAGETLAKETVEMITKAGSEEITKETAHQIVAQVTKRAAVLGEIAGKEIVEKSGLSKALTESAEILFQQLQHGNRALTKHLVETGFSKVEAKAMTQAATQLFRNSATKKEIIEVLAEEASKRIAKEVEARATHYFVESFETHLASALLTNAAFKQSLEAISKKAGITSAKFMSQLVEGAAKGFKEGLEKGLREAVELAIKKALAKVRFHLKVSKNSGNNHKNRTTSLIEIDDSDVEYFLEDIKTEKLETQALKISKTLSELDKKFEIEVKDGVMIRVEYYVIDTSKIYTGKRDIIGSSDPIARERVKAVEKEIY